MSTAQLGLGSFSAVDAGPDTQTLVGALDEQAALPAIQRLRARAVELLAPRQGQRLVDLGCGTGDVTRTLGAAVGPGGAVLGVDPSDAMLTEARRRTTGWSLPVEFRAGDIGCLDLDDGSFDGAFCERVFQHLARPEAAMAELARITRPGGRIVVVDTDWGMHAIHGADSRLTDLVVESWARNAANGWSGRRLPSLFIDAGIPDPVVAAETVTSTAGDRPTRPPFTTMAAVAVADGALDADESRTWLAQLAEAGDRGRFFWATTVFAVAGTRPYAISSRSTREATSGREAASSGSLRAGG